jgi:hypothetical protein
MKKLILLFVLAACSFKPVFSGDKTDIYVAPISGINGIELRNALNTKFGGPHENGAPYTLRVTLKNPITKYKALEPTGDATWQEIYLSANYVLEHNGEKIASGTEVASESYTFVRYLVAANASYNNAVANTITVLADKIGTRVIAEISEYETIKK